MTDRAIRFAAKRDDAELAVPSTMLDDVLYELRALRADMELLLSRCKTRTVRALSADLELLSRFLPAIAESWGVTREFTPLPNS